MDSRSWLVPLGKAAAGLIAIVLAWTLAGGLVNPVPPLATSTSPAATPPPLAAPTSPPATPTILAAPPTDPASPSQVPSAPPSPTVLPGARPIQIFFSRRPESDSDFTAVFPVQRTSPDSGVARAAIEQLIAGPTAEEQRQGYFSELGGMLRGTSTCGGPDFELRIEADTRLAVLRFCRQVSSAGIGQDARAQSQINATLTQFSTIQRTRLLTSTGDCLFDQSGLNTCLR